MPDPNPDPIFKILITVPAAAVDENGHVNNVQYVQWMQDIAVQHYTHLGGVTPTQATGATWVVRSHQVEYFRPAYAGEQIEGRTWVANLRRVRSLRRYEFVRLSDGATLVRGATEWVFVDAISGSPRPIPPAVAQLFTLLPDPA
jgi:acyl-CoA thioester hydrolase